MPHNGHQSSSVGIGAVAQANATLDVIDHLRSAVRSEHELAAFARMRLVARIDQLAHEAKQVLASLREEIAEYRRLEADPDADLYLHAEEPVPPYSQRRGVDVHAGEGG
jgi:hypothetical protein